MPENIPRRWPLLHGWSEDCPATTHVTMAACGCQSDWIHHLQIQIKLSISSSHLQLESLSRHLIVLQRMQCKNYAQTRISAVCQCLMSLLSVHALPVVNALTRSLKSTAWSRAVRIFHCRCISICLLDSNCHSLFRFF